MYTSTLSIINFYKTSKNKQRKKTASERMNLTNKGYRIKRITGVNTPVLT